MIKSPSKHLSRAFLHALIENHFLSPRGKEYCAAEVIDLYHSKESEAADREWRRALREENERRKPTMLDMINQIKAFQVAVLPNTISACEPLPVTAEIAATKPNGGSAMKAKKKKQSIDDSLGDGPVELNHDTFIGLCEEWIKDAATEIQKIEKKGRTLLSTPLPPRRVAE